MNILHISFDYPDEINPAKTIAVKQFIEASGEYNANFCISLNRIFLEPQKVINIANEHISLGIWGLPKGLFLIHFLNRCYDTIQKQPLDFTSFDYFHGHKLTYEGVIAKRLAEKYNKPYCISIRNTDFNILKYKSYLKEYYFQIIYNSLKILIISPWMLQKLRSIFKDKWNKEIEDKIFVIGNIVPGKIKFTYNHNNRYVFPFNFRKKRIKDKNFNILLKAIHKLKADDIDIHLDILGDGPARNYIERAINKFKVHNNVRLPGFIKNDRIIDELQYYKALIMCSWPETFGLVYVEALKSGIPIIHSKNTGIDGFFDKKNVAIKVSPRNLEETCNAIKTMEYNYDFFKKNVRKLQTNGGLSIFERDSIAEKINQEVYI